MTRLWRLFAVRGAGFVHIRRVNSSDERARRVASLDGEEQTAYRWLLEGYTEAWTAETMGLLKRDAKKLYIGVYQKLGVLSAREIVHYYAVLDAFSTELSG